MGINVYKSVFHVNGLLASSNIFLSFNLKNVDLFGE